MARPAPLVLRVLSSSVAAAERAGGIVREVMRAGDLGLVDKGGDDPQTEADRSAQRCIASSLLARFPGLALVGEEGPCEAGERDAASPAAPDAADVLRTTCPAELEELALDDLVVWVDPLDGTAEYTQGLLEHVTVLVGLAARGRPVAGVVHQPYWGGGGGGGRTVWGLVGSGVGGIAPSPPRDPASPLVVTTSRSHSDPLSESCLAAIAPREVIRVGGAGYKVLQLLEGVADGYVFASGGCKKWDTCAPEAVLRAAGGVLTDAVGRAYSYGKDAPRANRSGVLAAPSPELHERLLALIPRSAKERLE